MAARALIMPVGRPETATGDTGRRAALLAAAGAIVLGSGITAGADASVANLGDPAGIDAELIAACHRVFATIEKQDALMEPFENLDPDHPYYRAHSKSAYEAVYELSLCEYHPGLTQAAQLPAQTRLGFQAKARLLLISLDDPDGEDDALAASLARDVLAGVV